MRSFALGLGLVLSISVHASEEGTRMKVNETSSKIEDVLRNKTFQEDKRITDIELKAAAGSLSRYSMKFDLSFAGPPVNDLTDSEMPNPDGRPRNNKTSLSGYIGLRYRINPNEAINASTGVKWYAPYQNVSGEKIELRKGEKRLDTASPQVSYDRTASSGSLQFRSSGSVSPTIDEYYKSKGQTANFGLSENLKWRLGQSRLVATMLTDVSLYTFKREYEKADGRVSNYSLNLIPGFEYKITDALNFKTSIAYSFANQRAFGSWWKWEQQQITQRVGFGWGITRDVYINPYLNFYTQKPAINTTSLSASTVFSIF